MTKQKIKLPARVIIAVDFLSYAELATFLKPFKEPLFLKLNFTLFYQIPLAVLTKWTKLGFYFFLDVKLYDIPSTVQRISQQLAAWKHVFFITVHALAGPDVLQAAMQGVKNSHTNIAAVTILTSVAPQAYENWYQVNFKVHFQQCLKWIRANHIKYVVCSAQESSLVKATLPEVATICPGIITKTYQQPDQRRTMTFAEAAKAKVDYIVVGRAIIKDPHPLQAYERIKEEFSSHA